MEIENKENFFSVKNFLNEYNPHNKEDVKTLTKIVKNEENEEIKEFLTNNKNFDVCRNQIIFIVCYNNTELATWIIKNHNVNVNKLHHFICMYKECVVDHKGTFTLLDKVISWKRWNIVKVLLEHDEMNPNIHGDMYPHPFIHFLENTKGYDDIFGLFISRKLTVDGKAITLRASMNRGEIYNKPLKHERCYKKIYLDEE